MTSEYDPEWVKFAKAMGQVPSLSEDIEARTKVFNERLTQLSKRLPPVDPGIMTREVNVHPGVEARIYTPPGAPHERWPLVMFFHGGGWQAGNLDTEDHSCRTVCAGAKSIVVSVNYRKGPYVKFPVPMDDCYAGYKWAISNADELNADPERCIFWGGSAGGGLAISVAYRIVQDGEKLAGLVAMQPMSLHPDACPKEYKNIHTAYSDNGGDVPLVTTKNAMNAFSVMGGLPPYADPSWFPQSLGADAFRGFPPTYIVNTDLECFRDDGGVLEAELKDAGVPVKRDLIKGFPHYFWVFPLPDAGQMFRGKLVDGFKWVLEHE